MIFPLIVIALLLCAEKAAGKKVVDCEEWACFTSKKCFGATKSDLGYFEGYQDVADNCASILMIRPYSKSRWLVVLESWDSSTTEVKVLQDSTEMFACKKEGSVPTASSSAFTGLERLKPFTDGKLSCQFYVGDGSTEILQSKGVQLKLISKASVEVPSAMSDSDMFNYVMQKTKCDVSNVQFEAATGDEGIAEPTKVSLTTVTCDKYTLQYKSAAGYVDVDGAIECKGTTSHPANDYEYKFTTADGGKSESGKFFARCYTRVCSLCTSQPETPSGKTAPTLADAEGCKTLTCEKFFKIGEVFTPGGVGNAVCTKNDNVYQWKVGDTTLDDKTEVECVDQIPCTKFVCSTKNKCDKGATGLPTCNATGILTTTIKEKNETIVSIACDSSTGRLTRAAENNTTDNLPDNASFFCKAPAESSEQVAAAGMKTAMQACLGIAATLSILLIGCSVALVLHKRRQKQASAGTKTKKTEEE